MARNLIKSEKNQAELVYQELKKLSKRNVVEGKMAILVLNIEHYMSICIVYIA